MDLKMEMNKKSDGQCAMEALGKLWGTKWGKVFLTAAASVLVWLGSFIPLGETTVDSARELQSVGMAEIFRMVREIRHSDNIPEKLQWDLVRLEGVSLANQAYGLAFMEVAQELLPENDYEAIYSLARERVEETRRELEEAATPTIPPSLQEKLKQFEGGHDAD